MQEGDQSNPSAAGNSAVENPVLSEADLIASFMTEGNQDEAQDETRETESAEAEDDAEEAELEESEGAEAEEPEESEEESGESNSILEQLGNLSAEDWDKLAKDRKSGLSARIAELTRRAKSAEEREQALLQRVNNPEADPLASKPKKTTDDRVTAINDFDGLRAFKEQHEEAEEWAQRILDRNGKADGDDVVFTTPKGQELTKDQVVFIRDDARQLLKKDIPARSKELQETEAFHQAAEDVEARMPTVFPALKDEKSAASEARKQLLETPVLVEAMKQFPALKPWAAAVTAFASHSVVLAKAKGKQAPAEPAKGEKKKAAPPSNPSGVAAAGVKTPKAGDAKIADLERKYAESGSSEDLVRLETARMGG